MIQRLIIIWKQTFRRNNILHLGLALLMFQMLAVATGKTNFERDYLYNRPLLYISEQFILLFRAPSLSYYPIAECVWLVNAYKGSTYINLDTQEWKNSFTQQRSLQDVSPVLVEVRKGLDTTSEVCQTVAKDVPSIDSLTDTEYTTAVTNWADPDGMNIVSSFGVLPDYTGQIEYQIIGASTGQDIYVYDTDTGEQIAYAPAVDTSEGVDGIILDPVTYTGVMDVVAGEQSNIQTQLIASGATAGLYTVILTNPADGSIISDS